MKLVKYSVCYIGVVLSTTPIFNCAVAQQGPNLLLEMQSMRAEIAELRDMVERQGYEVRRLKQQLKQANTTVNHTQPGTQRPLTIPETTNSLGIADSSIDNTVFNANQLDRSQGSSQVQMDTQTYSGQPNAYQAGVEERTIKPIQQSTTDKYPPVDEISLGGDAVPVVSNQPQSTGQSGFIAVPTVHPLPTQTTVPAATQVPIDASSTGSQPITPQNNVSATPLPAEVATANAAATNVGSLSEQDYYQQGFDLLKGSKYKQAIELFEKQIQFYPNGGLVDDAHYWIAEAMYVNRKLDTSKQYFKLIINQFKQSPRLPDAMLKTAYIEQEQGNKIEARILLQEIIQYHPRSNAAISAKNRLAELN